MNIKSQYPDAILIFITAPDVATLKERLTGRGTESEEVILKRLKRAKEESEDIDEYEYVVVNDDLDACVDSVNSIIVRKKCLRENNIELIEELQKELSVY